MRLYDISKTISEDMVVYKNKESKKIRRNVVANHAENGYHESRIDMDMHCGTHMDAPLHMLDGGATIESLELRRFLGDCKLYDLTHIEEKIFERDIAHLDIAAGDRVLLKTRNSFDTAYNPRFVYLEEEAAQYLVRKGIQCLGIDAMSVERDKPGHPTHKILLGAGIGVLEDLQLKDVPQGRYFLSALPLKIQGADASPIRAVLMDIAPGQRPV